MATAESNATFREFVHFWFKYCESPSLEVPEVHEEIIEFLENDINWHDRTGVLEAFRGIGKSSLVGLFIVWKLIQDPTLNFLIISAEDGLAKKMVKHAKSIITQHPLAKHLEPKSKKSEHIWKANEIDVVGAELGRSRSIACRGIAGQITGLRCDYLIFDDVEVARTASTPAKHDELLDRIAEAANLVTPDKGLTLFIGTPWATDTIYEQQITLGYDFVKVQLFEAGTMKGKFPNYVGTSRWPERFTEEYIKLQQVKQKRDAKFLSQFQLIPEQMGDTLLNPNNLRVYNEEIEMSTSQGRPLYKIKGKRLANVSCFWDPALSRAKRDDSVLSVVYSTNDTGEYFIHRAIALQGDVYEQCAQIRKLVLELNIPSVKVESNAMQAFAAQVLRKVMEGTRCAIKEEYSSQTKGEKILDAFEVHLSRRAIYVHDSVYKSKFTGQLRSFTGTTNNKRDDYIDCTAMAILNQPMRLKSSPGNGQYVNGNWRGNDYTATYGTDPLVF